MKRRALFLDRDGIINVDHSYVHKSESFEFLDGIFDLVKKATELQYLVIVITNQAGIGRGYFTEEDFLFLNEWMLQEFSARNANIDAVYYCPYHPEHGIGRYRVDSLMRKPGPGMLIQACNDFDLDMANSIMLGDKKTDMQAAMAAGVGKLLWFKPDEDCELGMAVYSLSDVIDQISEFDN